MATALFTRWFQFQIFAPDSRLHRADAGAAPAPTQRVLVDFIHLRRRLETYIASTHATQVFARRGGAGGWTPPTSFSVFARAAGEAPAFAFGPDLWGQPAPVTTDEDLRVALPADTAWVDFWSGVGYPAGQVVQTPIPSGVLPLFARAGAILPLEILSGDGRATPTDIVELRIYPGADGRRNLREGDAEIPLSWDDQARVLRIGARPGGAKRCRGSRRFEIVVVRPGRGIGVTHPERADLVVDYTGEELRLRLPEAQPRPPAPTGLRAAIQDGRLHLTWHEVGPDVIYRLKRIPADGGPAEEAASALLAPRHSLPAPASGETLRFVVTATNGGGEGAASAVLSVAGDSEPAKSPSPAADARPPRWEERASAAGAPLPRFDPARWTRLAGVSGPSSATSGERAKPPGFTTARS